MFISLMSQSLQTAALILGAATLGGPPDLTIPSGFLEDPQADPGDNVSVEFTLFNGGSEDAEDFLIGYYLSDDPVWSPDDLFIEDEGIGNVEAGEVEDESEQLTVPSVSDGDYYIVIVADSANVVGESDESNNTFALAITVGDPGPKCVADFDASGSVDGADLASLLAAWMTDGPTDLDGDNVTGPDDLAILLSFWGECG